MQCDLKFFVEFTTKEDTSIPLIQSPIFNTVCESLEWRKKNVAYQDGSLLCWLMIAEVEKGTDNVIEVISSEVIQ